MAILTVDEPYLRPDGTWVNSSSYEQIILMREISMDVFTFACQVVFSETSL